ncbi:MAG TPA: M12 family metallo-peptidase, partial [Steroidobacteraceae bacterium]|nr:M12 family metallo-peptidase [Steroidobacteraceae bacterium]
VATAPFLRGMTPTRRLSVALVADALLAAQDGEQVEVNLLAQLNMIDGLFANQLGVHVAASSVSVYTLHLDEPFGRTTDAGDLLQELATWRADDQQQRAAGLTHLFTGRKLDGRTVGMGYLGTVCSRRFSASLSQATAAVSLAALIAAHEMAHVLGAPHDGERDSACAATPADYLMAPRINGSQEFSACSLEQMAPQVEAASCLVPIQAPGVWPADGASAPVQGGGGGALPGEALLMLVLLWASRARCWRLVQTRSNHAAR